MGQHPGTPVNIFKSLVSAAQLRKSLQQLILALPAAVLHPVEGTLRVHLVELNLPLPTDGTVTVPSGSSVWSVRWTSLGQNRGWPKPNPPSSPSKIPRTPPGYDTKQCPSSFTLKCQWELRLVVVVVVGSETYWVTVTSQLALLPPWQMLQQTRDAAPVLSSVTSVVKFQSPPTIRHSSCPHCFTKKESFWNRFQSAWALVGSVDVHQTEAEALDLCSACQPSA